MPEARRGYAPWIATGAAAVLFAAALLVFLLVGSDEKASGRGTPAFTDSEQAAISAAGTETANLLSFRRAHFEADFKRALGGATGKLVKDIRGKKAATLKAMTDGKFDLSANVTHSALVGPAEDGKPNSYVVLVSLNGIQSTQKNSPNQQNLAVTVVKKSGKWLVSGVLNVGVGA